LALATYWTLRIAIADQLFRARSLDRVERAVRIAPGNAQYFAGLAEYREAEGLDPDAALAESSRLNPMDSSVKIRRGLRAEFNNDFALAEKFLLEAAAVDKLFDPRAALMNFYFRRNNPEPFWRRAREAFAISYGDLTSLFRLCWRMTPDPQVIRVRALPSDRQVLRKYLRFLLAENRLYAAEPIASQLAVVAEIEDVPAVLDFIDRRPMLEAWNSLCVRNLMPFAPLAPDRAVSLTNGDFRVAPTSRGFDWRIAPTEGVSAVQVNPRGLRIDLSGKQPEQCELLVQWVALSPGKNCHLRFRYQTSTTLSGLQWRLIDQAAGVDLLPASPQLSSADEKQEEIAFAAPGRVSNRNPKSEIRNLFSLVLGYSRAVGTPRQEGSITLREMELGCAN
jgi:hypothetical protein